MQRALLTLALAALPAPSAAAQCELTLLESRAPNGDQANADSIVAKMSGDASLLSFYSLGTNLLPGVGTPARVQLFLQERSSGALSLLSADGGGSPGDDTTAAFTDFSSDGRFVVFDSLAANLVPGDTNGTFDVFLRDLQAGTIVCLSRNAQGTIGDSLSWRPAISKGGRYVVFASNASNLVPNDTNGNQRDTFLYDRLQNSLELVSRGSMGQGDGQSNEGEASDDGRFVVYQSHSTNLVPGDTNGVSDLFLLDRTTGGVERLDVAPDGSQGNGVSSGVRISPDGTTVIFSSDSTNLVAGDTNGTTDVFARDLANSTTRRISVSSSGEQADDECSLVFFADGGRFAAFSGAATNLAPGDTNGQVDAFWHDLETGATRRVSLGHQGQQGTQGSAATDVSDDGRVVAFNSFAPNLIADDTNGIQDVFVRELWPAPRSFCPATANSTGAPATLVLNGPPLVTGGGFTLVSEPVPNTIGLFFAGTLAVQAPFGNGVRCAGGTVLRFQGPIVSQAGALQRGFGFQGPVEAQLAAGTTWNFQAWFRDFGGAGFNLSQALRVTFCD